MKHASSVVMVLTGLALTHAAPIAGQAAPPAALGTIVTSGLGEVTLPPDRATVRLEVNSRAASAAEATRRNAVRARRVLDSLNAVKASDDTAEVVSVAVQPNNDFEHHKIVDYGASAVVRMSIHNLDRLGAVLDAAFGAGADGVERIAFHSNREAQAADDALARAYRQARHRAETIAAATGEPLGALLEVSTDVPDTRTTMVEEIRVTVPVTSLTPQDVVVRQYVHARWQIAPAH